MQSQNRRLPNMLSAPIHPAVPISRTNKAKVSAFVGSALAMAWAAPSAAAVSPCTAPAAGEPMLITSQCQDPVYNAENFVIEGVTETTSPMPLTKVVGHFKATTSTPQFTVTMYFPPADKWQRRFFQHAYPLEQPENLHDVAFALSSGGFLVVVKGVPCGCGGYRPDAGAAKVAVAYARKFYRSQARIRGYLWGGSGGGLLTSSAAENTQGVWGGVLPYVLPNAGSLLNANAIGALSGMVLREKFDSISDALKPGGSGHPEAELSAEQKAMFNEALAMGLPRQTFEMPSFSGGILLYLSGGVRSEDPAYVRDFWTKPGYEGSNPPAYLGAAKVDDTLSVLRVERDSAGAPLALILDRAPKLGSIGALGLELSLLPMQDGVESPINGQFEGAKLLLNPGTSEGALSAIREGSRIRASNLFYLALNYYHRHALPLERDMYTYDQFRKTDGTPKFVQRAYLGSSAQARSAAGGGRQTGQIRAKVIVNQSMLDGGAMPWMADWYAKRVRLALGTKRYTDNFRLFINDNANHFDVEPTGPAAAYTVNYVPSLYQSLRDLVAWVELGKAPPPSTRYTVNNGQVLLPAKASARLGLQPVVTVASRSAKRVEVAVGRPVTFTGMVAVPPGSGLVTGTAWWFGEGEPQFDLVDLGRPSASTVVTATHTYGKPGTYYVTFKAISQRDGSKGDVFTSLQNLDRMRVVVK